MVASLNHKRCTAEGLAARAKPTNWLWPGVLAAGCITLMTSRGKDGKTTLLSVLMSRLGNGGTLAGRPVTPARVVVYSEEAETVWEERKKRLGFGANAEFNCIPIIGQPSVEQWETTILELAEETPGIAVFDPISTFLPGKTETHAPTVIASLAPLRLLTDKGWAVLLLHHPVKAFSGGEMIERGSGAFTAFVDIVVKLYHERVAAGRRARRLVTTGRFFGLSEEFRIEMTVDGKDYTALPEEPDATSFEQGWMVLQAMLEDAGGALTRKQLLKRWLKDFEKPSPTTLRRWLERAERDGLIDRHGSGRYHDAFRYALKGQEPLPPRPDDDELFKAAATMLRGFDPSMVERKE